MTARGQFDGTGRSQTTANHAGPERHDVVLLSPVPRLLLTDDESAAALGMSVRKFRELADEPHMPKPVQLGPRMLRWSLTELQEAIARMPRQTQRAEPAELARARIERMKSGSAE
jgi:predicted DNA-binding transcriptional regulator AlpA